MVDWSDIIIQMCSEHRWRALHYNIFGYVHWNITIVLAHAHVIVHLVVHSIWRLLIQLHHLIRLILHYLVVLVLISEGRASAKWVVVQLTNLIIVYQPYVIWVDVYVHLVWKIVVKLLVPLKLSGLFWFLIILEVETGDFQFLVNTIHAVLRHVREGEIARGFVRFLF